MEHQHETRIGVLNIIVVWCVTGIGWIIDHASVQNVVLILAGLHTALQTFVLVRDKIVRKKRDRKRVDP